MTLFSVQMLISTRWIHGFSIRVILLQQTCFNNFYHWNLNNRFIVSAGRKTDSVHYDSICSTIFSLPAAFYFVFYYYTSWERVSTLKKIYCSHRKVQSQKLPHLHLQFFFKSRNALNLMAQWEIFLCLRSIEIL